MLQGGKTVLMYAVDGGCSIDSFSRSRPYRHSRQTDWLIHSRHLAMQSIVHLLLGTGDTTVNTADQVSVFRWIQMQQVTF